MFRSLSMIGTATAAGVNRVRSVRRSAMLAVAVIAASCASPSAPVASPSPGFPTDIAHDAPVIADHRITVNAPLEVVWKLQTDIAKWPSWQPDITAANVSGGLAPGMSFQWTTYGMAITSTVYALTPGVRILWGGNAGDIAGIHEWTFTRVNGGVEVRTRESFSGASVRGTAAQMQAALDGSLITWLERLKATAEATAAKPLTP